LITDKRDKLSAVREDSSSKRCASSFSAM